MHWYVYIVCAEECIDMDIAYMCVHMCIYTGMHKYALNAYMFVCMQVSIDIYICVCTSIQVCIAMYICIYIYVYVYIDMYFLKAA